MEPFIIYNIKTFMKIFYDRLDYYNFKYTHVYPRNLDYEIQTNGNQIQRYLDFVFPSRFVINRVEIGHLKFIMMIWGIKLKNLQPYFPYFYSSFYP